MTQEKEGSGFTVVDRRHGREDQAEEQPAAEGAPQTPPAAAETPRPPEPAEPAPGGPGGEMPAIDFATFLISLSTSAFYHLGLVAESEDAPPPEPNLPMARQTIDILELIQQKTRGNLDDQEAHLLESLLYELRMRFVEIQGR